ncbi:MAG: oxygenase MpaB family protein [Polyangiaceae bacterium]
MCPSSARAPRVSPDDTDAERIARLVADKARGEREGLFGPDSVTWLVLRETVLLFGGPRALLLQLAHPSVDAGIEQHSAIASDPLGRSVRTFRATYTLCFGDLASALGVVRAVHRRHTAVVGSTSTGTPYRALDPSLLRWVHATLFDTAVRMFETFVRPLSAAERARFQEESNLVEVAFGVAPDEVTSTSEAFDAYVTSVLEGDALRVTPHAVAQWETLVRQRPSGSLLGALFLPTTRTMKAIVDLSPARLLLPPSLRLFAAGMLPPRVRAAYGFRWTKTDDATLAAVIAAIRGARARLPPAVRFHPAYRQGMARLAS